MRTKNTSSVAARRPTGLNVKKISRLMCSIAETPESDYVSDQIRRGLSKDGSSYTLQSLSQSQLLEEVPHRICDRFRHRIKPNTSRR